MRLQSTRSYLKSRKGEPSNIYHWPTIWLLQFCFFKLQLFLTLLPMRGWAYKSTLWIFRILVVKYFSSRVGALSDIYEKFVLYSREGKKYFQECLVKCCTSISKYISSISRVFFLLLSIMSENGVEPGGVQVLDWTLGRVESSSGWTGNKNKFQKTFARR